MNEREYSDAEVDEAFAIWMEEPQVCELLALAVGLGLPRQHAMQILRCGFIAGNTAGLRRANAIIAERAAVERARGG